MPGNEPECRSNPQDKAMDAVKLPGMNAALNSALRAAQANGLTGAGAGRAVAGAGGTEQANFSNVLSGALKQVSSAQLQAQALQREFTMENPNVSLEQTMVAMQKGSLSFQAAVTVRNRLVQAYSDIMNMQV
jgi:flagellar hook-basal body complex protein FliE